MSTFKRKSVTEKLIEYVIQGKPKKFPRLQRIKVGTALILYNEIITLLNRRTGEQRLSYRKYFRPKLKQVNGHPTRVGLIQTYTSYAAGNETRVLRECDLFNLQTNELMGHKEYGDCAALVEIYHLLPDFGKKVLTS